MRDLSWDEAGTRALSVSVLILECGTSTEGEEMESECGASRMHSQVSTEMPRAMPGSTENQEPLV